MSLELTFETWRGRREGDLIRITARHGVIEHELFSFRLSETAGVAQRREFPLLYYGFGLVALLVTLAPFLWLRESLSGNLS